MKKTITLITLLMFAISQLFAQDKGDVAIALYQKAEDAYNIADYESALSSLKQVEQTIGSTNTKILYLKIKTLDMLAKVDGKSVIYLQQSLTTFFKLANKDSYPQNKYSEILLIDINLKQRAKDEEDAYNKAKNSGTLSSYDEFFTNYPNSKYKVALDGKYKELQSKQKADMQTKFEEQWKSENIPLIRKNRGTGIGLLVSGIAFMTGGSTLMAIGYKPEVVEITKYCTSGCLGSYLVQSWKVPKNYSFGDIVADKEGVTSELRAKKMGLAITGTLLFVTGVILAPLSSKYFKANKHIKQDAENNNIRLSLIQRGNSVGFAMNF